MNGSPSVVVNKSSGFFAALAKGFFGMIIVAIICVTVLGLYGMRMGDRVIDFATEGVPDVVSDVIKVLPEWQEALPPALSDALNDRRELAYRESIDVSARLAKNESSGGWPMVVVEVQNNGTETVTMLPLRITIEDEDGVPLRTGTLYAATQFAMENELPGPLLAKSGARKLTWYGCHGRDDRDAQVSVEIVDVRVANPTTGHDVAAPATNPRSVGDAQHDDQTKNDTAEEPA